jgi:mRNA-degrading endonuclease RelE of RelBE toxin-antitoxin system
VLADKSSPVLEFWKDLEASEQRKLLVLFAYLGDHGRITNEEKFKKVEGGDGIFEFKSFQIRIFCFWHKQTVYLADAVRKKQNKHRPQDVDRAEEYRNWFLSQDNPPGENHE